MAWRSKVHLIFNGYSRIPFSSLSQADDNVVLSIRFELIHAVHASSHKYEALNEIIIRLQAYILHPRINSYMLHLEDELFV